MSIRIGTRGSKLALAQTKIVEEKLKNLGHECEILVIATSGDKEKTKPLYDIGGKALFIKEIEEALIEKKIDIAVHSLKDVPGILPLGLKIAAMLDREDPSDVLISKYKSIEDLPLEATIGSSSPRRIMYIKQIRNDLHIVNLRGNVDTRFNKILSGELDATILASAGLKRLGGYLDSGICHPISTTQMLPAVGQGVIAIETRDNDDKILEIVNMLNHEPTWNLLQVERGFLENSFASCRSPVAALAYYHNGMIKSDFMIADDGWTRMITDSGICEINAGYAFGKKIAEKLKNNISMH